GIEPFNRFAIPEERYAPSLKQIVIVQLVINYNVVEKLVPPPVSDLSNDYIEVIHPPVPDLSSDYIELIPPPVPDPSSDSIELIPPPVCDLSNDSIELIPSPKPYVQIIQVRPYSKAIQSAKVRVMKSRVGKSRVLTDTPEKDEIEQDYVL
ncbi:Uncharacterized protein APZ42_009595, partial [Daphnia magna]